MNIKMFEKANEMIKTFECASFGYSALWFREYFRTLFHYNYGLKQGKASGEKQ